MKSSFQLLTILSFCLANSRIACAARILALFPFPSPSHCSTLQRVTLELAKRGHELVVFTTSPVGNEISKLPNYREIFLEKNAKLMPPARPVEYNDLNFLMQWWDIHEFMKALSAGALEHPKMIEMISPTSKEKFDLIIIEWMGFDALSALGYRFDSPVIGLLSFPLNIVGAGAIDMGLPFNLIDRPNYMNGIENEKTFVQRLIDIVKEIGFAGIHHYALPGQQEIVERYFGKNYPHVHDLMRNVSMIFGTQDDVMPYPTVGVPNIINIGGIDVTKEFDEKLPKEMKDFMEGGKDGVIYFSLEPKTKAKDTSDELMNIFLEAFSELPYRVLWKWEDDTLPGKSENVFISKWMPQRAILAHPNVKVFIYQGIRVSTEEAMFAGVPLIGIPLFADQPWNVNKMVSVGAAVKLEINNLTKEKMKAAILEVINDEKYKKNIIQFRDLVNDKPYDPIENTMWWIEYVIRHKGAHHLKIARANLPWYQSHHIDTLGFVFLVISLTIIVIYKIIKLAICQYFIQRKKNFSARKLKIS